MNADLPHIDYASHPAYGGMFEPREELREDALRLLDPVIREMTEVEEDRVRKFGYRYRARGAAGPDLVARGISQLHLPGPVIDRIQAQATPVIRSIQERIAATRAAGKPIRFKTVEQLLQKDVDTELWTSVDAMLRDMEVYDSVAGFFDAPSARINSLAIFVNPPNQNWANELFHDVDIGTPPTAGFHIDSNGKCYLKGILYLEDVGPEQGPFGIVPESHRWAEGTKERIYRRAFDRSRLLTRGADARAMFISLPEEMQVKAEFGGDMLPDSPEARRLLDQELRAVGPRGMLNVFYPEAIHRGGNVRAGERHAMQITLTAQY